MLKLTPKLKQHLPETDDLFRYFMTLKGDVLRDVKGRKTMRVNLAGEFFYIKQHTGVGWMEILKNILQLRWPVLGASNEWRALQLLDQNHIDAPKVMAYGERGINPAKRQSFVLMSELKNKLSLHDLAQANQCQHKQALIAAVAKITRQLHALGINHRDYYLVHIWLDEKKYLEGNIDLCLYDFHRAQINKKVPRRWLIKDLASLYFSTMDVINAREVISFLEIYFNCKEQDFDKKLLQAIEKKAIQVYQREYKKQPPSKSLLSERLV